MALRIGALRIWALAGAVLVAAPALAETPEEAENRIGQADDRRRAADHRSTESIDEQKAQNEGIE